MGRKGRGGHRGEPRFGVTLFQREVRGRHRTMEGDERIKESQSAVQFGELRKKKKFYDGGESTSGGSSWAPKNDGMPVRERKKIQLI